ncbi:extracellular serine/threonine protein CG31145 isoform X3 [Drosophila hydei]|uniref:Extracellular serine/threonine protein CG31145 isoform X3 n=1 Tax=Drosophila hydei TaxID=7224 RepID=A0A6J1MGM6_DROHY|nr:extracellular serine/threonine protein CG31145 isoform X3 [Drosophila hydei]
MSLSSRISLTSSVKQGSDAGSNSERNANIRNLFAPSPAELAKRKAARQRSQSSVCLDRGQLEQKEQQEQLQVQVTQRAYGLSQSNQALRRSMGQIAIYNGTNANNGDYQRGICRGGDGPDINQMATTRNQSAMEQYKNHSKGSRGRQFNAYGSEDAALGDWANKENKDWQPSALQLATEQLQVQEQQPLRRPSSTWHERKNWQAMSQPENFINSSMQKQQQKQQEQELDQQTVQLKLAGVTASNNVDFGNEMTWGNAAEKSQPLNHLRLQQNSLQPDTSKADQRQDVYSAAIAYDYDADKVDEEKRQSMHSESCAQFAPLAERLQRFRQRQKRYNSADIENTDLSAEQISVANLHGYCDDNNNNSNNNNYCKTAAVRRSSASGAVDATAKYSTDALEEAPWQGFDVQPTDVGNDEAVPRRRVLIKRRIVRSTRSRSTAAPPSTSASPHRSAVRPQPKEDCQLGWLARLRTFRGSGLNSNLKAASTTAFASYNLESKNSKGSTAPTPIMAVLRTMKLKERLAISLGATLVLLTLLLIVDVQMDFGVANRHLLQQQHQKLRFGNNNDYNEAGTAGAGGMLHEFKRKFLQKSNSSGSKEASTPALTSGSQGAGTASGQEGVISGSTLSTRKPKPHDRYMDLQQLLSVEDYIHVIVDNEPDVTINNPTLGEMLHREVGANASNLERFQLRITKKELYSEQDTLVDAVLRDMIKLPIQHVACAQKKRKPCNSTQCKMFNTKCETHFAYSVRQQ